MPRLAILIVLLACSFAKAQNKYVLLVSFDGFRHDYAEKYDLQNFKDMAQRGASAEMMIPSYPSKTFPNHYTLVSGLYPGHHGLVDNSFYDRVTQTRYSTSDREIVENPVFYGGWPLWQWVQEHDMKSASFFWVGSEAPIHGRYPDYWKRYDHNLPNQTRIDSVFHWFGLPQNERPNFVSLYFALVDDAGHRYGPNDQRTAEALREADALLRTIREKIRASGLPVNLVVVSDHGMTEIIPNDSTFIEISDYAELPANAFKITNSGSHMHIYAADADFGEQWYNTLKKAAKHFDIYAKNEIPDHWQYSHPRVGDYLLVAHPGYSFRRRDNFMPFGDHGYDPLKLEDMGAIFYAEGPGIVNNTRLPRFQNVDVYSFICALLGIPAAENDGDLTILGKALRN